MMRRPITLAEQLDAEDAKLVVLARAAMARAEAGAGAAVRDVDGRTYAAAPVALSALELTGLQAAVAAGRVQWGDRSSGRRLGGRVR